MIDDIPSSLVNLGIIEFPFFHLQNYKDIANKRAARIYATYNKFHWCFRETALKLPRTAFAGYDVQSLTSTRYFGILLFYVLCPSKGIFFHSQGLKLLSV